MLFCKGGGLFGVFHRAPVCWQTLKSFWLFVYSSWFVIFFALHPVEGKTWKVTPKANCLITVITVIMKSPEPIESARILGGLQLALDQENQKVAGRSWWEWSTSSRMTDNKNTTEVVLTFWSNNYFWKVIFWRKVLKLIGWYMLRCLFVVASCWTHLDH